MRQLTATQKIAVLENRVAHLEKQAMLDSLKAKAAEAMEPFKRLFPETKKIIKDTRKSPKQIAKDYMKVRNNSDFKRAVKQVQKEAGGSPVKQVAYVIDVYKSGELDSSRRASMRRRGSALLALTILAKSAGIAGSLIAILCIADICYQWVVSKIPFRKASMNKEASYLLITLGLALLIVSTLYFGNLGHRHYLESIERNEKPHLHNALESLFEDFFESVDFSNVNYSPFTKPFPTFHGYAYFGSEEREVTGTIFDNNKFSVKIDGAHIYYDRMDPPLLNSSNRRTMSFQLRMRLGLNPLVKR